MASGDISPEVKRFILGTINSVEQLEVLLFMMSNADRAWSASQVAEKIRLSEEAVAGRLADLEGASLVASQPGEEPSFRYLPASSALAEEVAISLDEAYRERKDTIIQLIFSRPLENIRVFADAFRIRKGDD